MSSLKSISFSNQINLQLPVQVQKHVPCICLWDLKSSENFYLCLDSTLILGYQPGTQLKLIIF